MTPSLRLIAAVLAVLVAALATAAAQNCGKAGQRECTVFERVPSCHKGLAAKGGKCHDCGADGQMACPITVQGKGCDKGLIEARGRCENCGGEGERACPFTVQRQGCDGRRVEIKGRCRSCGGGGEPACPVTEGLRGCDDGHIEVKGRCESCGDEGERACPITVQLQGCNGKQVEAGGRCEPCGAKGQRACPITEQIKGCDGRQIEVKGRCEPCGGKGERACPLTVGKACDAPWAEGRRGRCETDGHVAENPFEVVNRSGSTIYVTAHFQDLDREVPYSGDWNVLTGAEIAPGDRAAFNIAGYDCLPPGTDRGQFGNAISNKDHCAGMDFGLIVWRSKRDFDEAMTKQFMITLIRGVFSDMVGSQTGLAGETGAPGALGQFWFNGVVDIISQGNGGRLPIAEHIHLIVPAVSQQDEWIAFWGHWNVYDRSFKEGPIDPMTILPPCEREPMAAYQIVRGEPVRPTFQCIDGQVVGGGRTGGD